jgi:hypothetical protein
MGAEDNAEFDAVRRATEALAARFDGVTVDEAHALAARLGVRLRIEETGSDQWYTSDQRVDRITVTTVDGITVTDPRVV